MILTKKVPMRMCIGCNEMKPKKELVRIVKSQSGEISMDLTGKKPGRGAYVCRNEKCFAKAKKSKRLNRTFASEISEELYNQLLKEMNNIE